VFDVVEADERKVAWNFKVLLARSFDNANDGDVVDGKDRCRCIR